MALTGGRTSGTWRLYTYDRLMETDGDHRLEFLENLAGEGGYDRQKRSDDYQAYFHRRHNKEEIENIIKDGKKDQQGATK